MLVLQAVLDTNIALWCAVILHGRVSGQLRERGMIIGALMGSIITSFSWFGVNLLGIGLHTYGFMEGAFRWLAIFVATQCACILWAAFSLQARRSGCVDAVKL